MNNEIRIRKFKNGTVMAWFFKQKDRVVISALTDSALWESRLYLGNGEIQTEVRRSAKTQNRMICQSGKMLTMRRGKDDHGNDK